jgi:ribose 5-phosphate isomerase A
MDFKKEAARKAATLAANKTTIGLGAGSTIAFLIDFLKQDFEKAPKVTFVTSSFVTHQLLLKNQLPVQPISDVERVDIYFDGCDQFDKNLNALKSGGGIHTMEKLIASMADEFALIGDESKEVECFDHRFPVVIEVLPQAIRYVPNAISKHFPETKIELRTGDKKEGTVITGNGNYLFDVWFLHWPSLSTINPTLKSITGIVETSLFYQLAKKAIIAGKDGAEVIERTRQDA